jgi:hypothetical protein
MTELHQFVADVLVLESAALLIAVLSSFAAGRRSAGLRDHRLAVDRLILLVLGTVLANGVVGGALIATGSRPADGLHLLYGPAAFVTPLIGWWLAGRAGSDDGQRPPRSRRDGWLVAASAVLLGLVLRLFMTG